MARGRMLNKSICLSLRFHDMPDDTTRLLATWIIPHLDCNGVFHADPTVVKSMVFPRRSDLTVDVIEQALNEMEAVGIMVRFRARRDTWQYWPGFADNQVGLRADRETTSFPEPPAHLQQAQDDDADTMPDDCWQDAGTLPEDCPPKLSEVNINESPTADKPAPAPRGKQQPSAEQPKPKTELMDVFIETTGIKMPTRKAELSRWWSSIGELYEIVDQDVGKGQRLIRQSVDKLRAGNMTIATPGSLVKTARSIAANGGGKAVIF